MTSSLAQNLSSARLERQISLSKLSELVGIDKTRLENFELGEKTPNRDQINKLALVLGTSGISLRSKKPVKLKPLPVDFRTEQNRPAMLSLAGAREVDKALKHLRFLNRYAVSNSTFRKPFSVDLRSNPSEVGMRLREHFSIDSDFQKNASATEFYRHISNKIQNDGCFVFRRPAPVSDFRGFTTDADPFPLILINTKDNNSKAQLFTLCHEYVHQLIGQTGISDPRSTHSTVERFCNKVAINFLAPESLMSEVLKKNIYSLDDTQKYIGYISNQLNISYFASALRLNEIGAVKKDYVRNFLQQSRYSQSDAKKGGGRSVDTEYDYGAANLWKFGSRYISELGRILDQGRVSMLDIEQHVGLTEEALVSLLKRASFEQTEAKSEVSRIEFDSFAEPLADYKFDVV